MTKLNFQYRREKVFRYNMFESKTMSEHDKQKLNKAEVLMIGCDINNIRYFQATARIASARIGHRNRWEGRENVYEAFFKNRIRG